MRMGGDTTHKKTQDLCKIRPKPKRDFYFLCVMCTERTERQRANDCRLGFRTAAEHEQSTPQQIRLEP